MRPSLGALSVLSLFSSVPTKLGDRGVEIVNNSDRGVVVVLGDRGAALAAAVQAERERKEALAAQTPSATKRYVGHGFHGPPAADSQSPTKALRDIVMWRISCEGMLVCATAGTQGHSGLL